MVSKKTSTVIAVLVSPVPVSEIERGRYSDLIVGKKYCVSCGQNDVKILNDKGKTGDRRSNYFEKHHVKGTGILCRGSEKRVVEME